MHLLAEHEGFKAHLRGDGIHHIRPGQQGERRAVRGNDPDAATCGVVGQIAAFFPGNDIRMRFYPDMSKRVCGQGRFQHGAERSFVRAAERHAGVSHGLIENQHTGSRYVSPYPLRRVGSVVVLAQVIADNAPHGAPGGRHQLRCFPAGSIEQVLQIGRLPGVIVDARMVHHQRERLRSLAAQVKGAQKAVLQSDVREVVLSRVAAGLVRCGFMAPAENIGLPPKDFFAMAESFNESEKFFLSGRWHGKTYSYG